MNIYDATQLDSLDFAKADGLLPVIVQHHTTGEVLMLGYANREAVAKCLETGDLWMYSRSRDRLWRKGEESGNTQKIVAMSTDCDSDALLVRVDPRGPVCHTGARSCFGDPPTIPALTDTINQRMRELSEGSYTVRLLNDANLRLKKLGEEAVELAVACNEKNRQRAAEEGADLIYHMMVAVAAAGGTFDDVLRELEARRR